MGFNSAFKGLTRPITSLRPGEAEGSGLENNLKHGLNLVRGTVYAYPETCLTWFFFFDFSEGFLYPPIINLLKPTGHVMHQQFNIQQLYALPTLYLCVFYLSENKQRLVPLTA